MKQEPSPKPGEITSEFIDILRSEGDKAWAACQQLNQSSSFIQSASTLADETHQDIRYKAEHILLRDLVKVYSEVASVYPTPEHLPTRAKFTLIYLYERLQGKDLGHAYTVRKLNELTSSPQFNKNVKIILDSQFFAAKKAAADEYVLPALLSREKNDLLLTISSFLTRIASVLIKADDTISKEEEALLKRITERISNPKITSPHATFNDIPENDSLEIVMAELQELIGLDSIKRAVEDLTNFLKVRNMREEKRLKTPNVSLHAVFMGPPGTGKTTVARMLGRIYKHLGYLEKGHLIETDRAGMVAGYVGQTAIKSDEIIKSAVNGVLFIDEAYSLASGNFNDYGREAVEILLKRMEDQRNSLVVVVAGYPDEIEMFIRSNPGLQSRFNRYFTFDHFNADELLKIFTLIAQKADFTLTEDAREKLTEILERISEKKHRGFGNARAMRNLFEKVIERQANRIVSITPITEEILRTLTEEDIPDVLKTVKDIVGFEEEEDEEQSSKE